MWIMENWNGSPTEVKRKFRLAFNLRYDQVPHRAKFSTEFKRIKKNKGALHLVPGKKVCPDRIKITPESQNPEQVEAVKQHARDNPSGMSIRERSYDLDIAKTTVRTILRYNLGQTAWKICEVQELKPRDFPARLTFAQWLLQQTAGFEDKVIWTGGVYI